jgi:diguanylate cyclase (GGDEF)-like protein/PAS domain S-box-containing protein
VSQVHINIKQRTLRDTFSRRLLLLLGMFSVLTSIIITLAYQQQTDRFNRAELSGTLSHLLPRIQSQQLIWSEQANLLLGYIEFSGFLGLNEPQRHDQLQIFFSVMSENMGMDGIVISDTKNQRRIFSYWNNADMPGTGKIFAGEQAYWYDDRHAVLYSVMGRKAQVPGSGGLEIYFFKAWDSAMLSRLDYPGITTYLTLGKQSLLSSAGNLALQEFNFTHSGYSHFYMDKVSYHQNTVVISDVQAGDGKPEPLTLTVRALEKNSLPIGLILGTSFFLIVLFGILLFTIFGHWLNRLGSRLDRLSLAVLNSHTKTEVVLNDESVLLLAQADTEKKDQIGLLAEELSVLMKTAALRDEEQRAYLQTLDLLQDAVIEFSPDGRLIRATEAWNKLTGVNDIANCNIEHCVYPEDVSDVLEQISALTHEQKQQVNIRFRIFRQGDVTMHYWVEGRFAAVKHHDKIVSIRGVVRDITNTYRQERQINHMALHDALTDLPNRVLLEDRMEMAISRAARNGKRVALGFIDLDHFKQVNDNFGHKIGDLMLKEVTAKLGSALRVTDTLSRWGGDEFVVLCPDLESLADARDITQKLSLLTEKNISIEGTEFPFIFSAGFAVYPDDAGNGETLLAQADRAMFYAKAQGRNNIQFFNTIAAKESGRQSFYIQSRLSNAISNNEIQAWLQPLVSATTGKVIGAEVLARWHEADQGWIPPSVFIPMAESLGLIDRLGQSVWQQALHAFTLLPEDHRLSVNLSKRQLFSSTIVQQFCDDVARTNIAPERIMLEITESIALSDVAFARERIVELDSRGFGIAVDDFGVGYSSLSQLHEIPADELKLDISFVRRIHEKSGFSMASAIISIAKALNMECVAEGVEDAQTAELLATMGVDVLQGYYFAKPMPIEDYISWLAAGEMKAELP